MLIEQIIEGELKRSGPTRQTCTLNRGGVLKDTF